MLLTTQFLTEGVAWKHAPRVLAAAAYEQFDVVLQIVDSKTSNAAPHDSLFTAAQKRRHNPTPAPSKTPAPMVVTLPSGSSVCRMVLPAKQDDTFEQHESLRRALAPLLSRHPKTLAIDIRVNDSVITQHALYAALVAAAPITTKKHTPLKITLAAPLQKLSKPLHQTATIAAVNTLARRLIRMPPNVLTPQAFARTAASIAKQNGIAVKTYTAAQLQKMGAGAICGVGRASTPENAPAIVHLSYRPKNAKSTKATKAAAPIALVGKGVCYDTGGINVKPASYMRGMSKDMAGAATAFASVVGAAQLQLPTAVDAWLVLAENAISADAYRPDEVIRALSGKTIEIIHTDAEGRMILADALTLAARSKPQPRLIISYATLTGTMHVALGERMSGVFASSETWQARALAAATASGERLCYFPMPSDYKSMLDSSIADIKQCSPDASPDHILAALFLKEFITPATDWLHLDLSSALCEGSLGALPTPINAFGVAWTLALLTQ